VDIQIEFGGQKYPVAQVGEFSCILPAGQSVSLRGDATIILTVDRKPSRRAVIVHDSYIDNGRQVLCFL